MTKNEITAEIDRLTSDYETAVGQDARKAAWAARETFVAKYAPPKPSPARSSRAGRRQAAERRAMYGWRR